MPAKGQQRQAMRSWSGRMPIGLLPVCHLQRVDNPSRLPPMVYADYLRWWLDANDKPFAQEERA